MPTMPMPMPMPSGDVLVMIRRCVHFHCRAADNSPEGPLLAQEAVATPPAPPVPPQIIRSGTNSAIKSCKLSPNERCSCLGDAASFYRGKKEWVYAIYETDEDGCPRYRCFYIPEGQPGGKDQSTSLVLESMASIVVM